MTPEPEKILELDGFYNHPVTIGPSGLFKGPQILQGGKAALASSRSGRVVLTRDDGQQVEAWLPANLLPPMLIIDGQKHRLAYRLHVKGFERSPIVVRQNLEMLHDHKVIASLEHADKERSLADDNGAPASIRMATKTPYINHLSVDHAAKYYLLNTAERYSFYLLFLISIVLIVFNLRNTIEVIIGLAVLGLTFLNAWVLSFNTGLLFRWALLTLIVCLEFLVFPYFSLLLNLPM
jgi:hypothetical protein